jgi:peptide deformylase
MPANLKYPRVNHPSKLKRLVHNFIVYINPTITYYSDIKWDFAELCLSVGMDEYLINRPKYI